MASLQVAGVNTHPPERILTPRLRLRRWRPADAPLLKAAIDASLPELKAWMPWARGEPTSAADLATRLERFEADWDAGREFLYGVFPRDESEAFGSCGIHPRREDADCEPDRVEIGYWIRTDVTGRGYATELAQALVRAASGVAGSLPVEIRCDPLNVRSAAVARRAGLVHVRTIPAHEIFVDGETRATMVWEWRA